MAIPNWVSSDVPLDKPSAARMYDYYLGGSHNFELDRKMAEQAMALWPDLPLIMQANRAFLRRAVNYLLSQGIDQFLDIGSGIPTVGNVHEVAHLAKPSAKVTALFSITTSISKFSLLRIRSRTKPPTTQTVTLRRSASSPIRLRMFKTTLATARHR